MRFAHPEWLMLLWVVPALWLIAIVTSRRAHARLRKGLGERMAPLLAKQVSPGRRRMKAVARSLALALAIVALARPQSGKGLSEIKVRGVELMVAIDVSTSMLAEDVKPSRLQFAKAELSRLLDSLAGDKVGLVGFAGSALLLSPLTNDISSLKMFLDSLSPYSVATQGTFFTQALQEAADAFERGGTDDDERSKTTRVILIMSDGEDQEKGALELAKKLSSQGIRIFTIAFGTERGGMIPIRDERGYLRSYKKDKSGKEVTSMVKGDFLKDLARVGQGTFHFATFGGNEARAVKADIDKLQKSEFASSMATQYEERFQWFLIAALFFVLLDLLIGEKGRGDRVWRGRFEAGLKSVVWCLLPLTFAALSFSSQAHADEFKGVRQNNKAVGNFKEERFVEALDGFTKSLSELPDSAEVHYNVGVGFMANKDDAKALTEFDVALKSNLSAEIAFKANFNRAVIFQGQKKVPEALDAYQRALEVKPDSVETKHNIELLIASGEGEGEGEGESKSDQNKEGKEPKEGKDQKPPEKPSDQQQTGPTPKPTPRPFKSEQLSQQDVGKILEELKRQEDQIREKMQREGGKESPRDKDW